MSCFRILLREALRRHRPLRGGGDDGVEEDLFQIRVGVRLQHLDGLLDVFVGKRIVLLHQLGERREEALGLEHLLGRAGDEQHVSALADLHREPAFDQLEVFTAAARERPDLFVVLQLQPRGRLAH